MFSLSDLANIGKTLKGFAGQVRANRVDQERLRQRREEVRYALAPRSDVIAAVEAWCDEQQAEYRQKHFAGLVRGLSLPSCVGDPIEVRRVVWNGLIQRGPDGQVHSSDVASALCGLFGDAFKQALVQRLQEHQWPEAAGLPLAQRDAEVDKIEAQLSRLESEEAKLVDAARKAGIAVD